MKSWLKSKTMWIGAVLEFAGLAIEFLQPIAELLPNPAAAKVASVILIVNGIIFQVTRVFTKLGITFKKT